MIGSSLGPCLPPAFLGKQMTNDLEIFDRELRQLCRKYPDLREEIERSIVRDARTELAARLAVECSEDEQNV